MKKGKSCIIGIKSTINIKSVVCYIIFFVFFLLSGSACTHQMEESGTAGTLSGKIQTDTGTGDSERVLTYESALEADYAYTGEPFVEVNGNVPFFNAADATETAFEDYAPLDSLGRCGRAYANICMEIMPTQERGSIGSVKPSGWHTVKYSGLVDGNYLYNRCHLIAYGLSAENANERNLITGTRYMNVEGMLPFENQVAEYVKKTGNHVLYRVTPVFEGDDLLAEGVLMEAYSVEDEGAGICFCIFAYNVQPGISIDYATGESRMAAGAEASGAVGPDAESQRSGADNRAENEARDYILNTNTKKFHIPSCKSVGDMKEENKEEYYGTRSSLVEDGYSPCGNCKP